MSCVCFVFRAVLPSSLLSALPDFLLKGRSLNSPRWDQGFAETQVRVGLFHSFSPTSAAHSMAVPETRPNHTIYINNLNEKIKKDGEFSGLAGLQAIPQEPAPSSVPSIRVSSSALSIQTVRVNPSTLTFPQFILRSAH